MSSTTRSFSRLWLSLALAAALTTTTSVALAESGRGHAMAHPAVAEVTPVTVASGTYQLDPTHTNVLVQWNHMGFSNPVAHFGIAEGTLVFDADDVSRSSVEVTLPLSALNSFSERFDQHLKGPDFFNAAQFPNITFKSTEVSSAGTNRLNVVGDLTVKDTTHSVTLEVMINGAGEHPMAKVPSVGFDARTSFKRSDFGLGAYAPNVSDNIRIRISTEGKQASK